MNSDSLRDFTINETKEMIDSAIKREFAGLNEPKNNHDEANGSSGSSNSNGKACLKEEEIFLNNDSSNDYHSDYDYSSNSSLTTTKRDELEPNQQHQHQQKPNQQQQQQSHHHNHIQNQNQNHHSDEPEQIRKLFIGGLDYKTSEATLKLHFEKFGDVMDCVVMREPQSRRSRGFGFVIYANSSMVDRAQEARPHEVDGRQVQSKRAISREDSGRPEAQATVKKVYLGGLSDDIEESELRQYFKDFGNIVNVDIVAHKDTGKRRGFAFVEYDDYDPVDKIVLKKFHTIKDKRIEAKKALSKVEMDARKRGDPRAAMAGAMIALSGPPPLDGTGGRQRPGRNGGGGGGSGGYLWDGVSYNAGDYAGLDGYHPQYHYGANNWMMHGSGQGASSYGFRGAYGRNIYANQASNWNATADYSTFPATQSGGAGPMRLSYQHRSWGPYCSGYMAHRGRGYNP